MSDDPIEKWLEDSGEAQVRLMMHTGSMPVPYNARAIEWLSKKDHENQRLSEASQAEQIDIARSAKDAAWVAADAAREAAREAKKANQLAASANRIAALALIAAAIAIVVSVMGLLHH